MSALGPDGRSRTLAVVLIGIGYALVGVTFAIPATHAQAWRLAAWAVSALGFAAHITYERFQVRSPPLSGAMHVAFAVAVGAFGLAVGANIHSMFVESTGQHRTLVLLALVIWPILTALPAFVVALGVSVVLTRAFRRAREG